MASEKDKKRKRRKPAAELDDAQVLRRLFPKPVRDEAKKEAEKAEKKGSKRHGRQDS